MSTRRDLWQLLWEVGTSRRLACVMLFKGQGPIWQTPDRCVWSELSEGDKRGIRDYVNDLEMIIFVILEELGLPDPAVSRIFVLLGSVGLSLWELEALTGGSSSSSSDFREVD